MFPRQEDNTEKIKKWSVKVYIDEDSKWKEVGTGYLHIKKEWNSQTEIEEDTLEIKVLSEVMSTEIEISEEKLSQLKRNIPSELKNEYILITKVSKENSYEKQADQIISWIDKGNSEEFALSFVDYSACNETWRLICNVTGKNPHKNQEIESEDMGLVITTNSLGFLDQLINEFETKMDSTVKGILENEKILVKIKEIFEMAEDIEDNDSLFKIFKCIKFMIYSNDISLLEKLLNDTYYLLLFGSLTYDPDNIGIFKKNYRDFFTKKSHFKTIENLFDNASLSKIHINFRLAFLRDSVLASKIDEILLNTINSIIYFNNNDLLSNLLVKRNLIKDLIDNNTISQEDKIDFFSEVFNMIRMIQNPEFRSLFLEFIRITNFLNFVIKLLIYFQSPLKIEYLFKLLDMIFFVSQFLSENFINCFLKKENGIASLLLKHFVNIFKKENEEEGYMIQCCEFIKFLLDPIHDKKTQLSDYIYEEFLKPLLQEIDKKKSNIIPLIFDIIGFCIKNHGFRIRQFLLVQKLIQILIKFFPEQKNQIKVNILDKVIWLSIIKLIKITLNSNDELLIKNFANKELISGIMRIFHEKKKDLITSACFEMFSIILKTNCKKMIKLLCENNNFLFELEKGSAKQGIMGKIMIKYEQYKEEDPFKQLEIVKEPSNDENDGYFENDDKEEKTDITVQKIDLIDHRNKLKNLQEKMKEERNNDNDILELKIDNKPISLKRPNKLISINIGNNFGEENLEKEALIDKKQKI